MAAEAAKAAPVRTVVARILRVHTAERAWPVGAIGEERVGRLLDRKLPESFSAFHDLLIGNNNRNVDHLVIGPTGVFTVNTKHHPNGRVWAGGRQIRVNGTKTDYVPKSLAEARDVQRLLVDAVSGKLWVLPVLAVLTDKLAVKGEPRVPVVRGERLVDWITSQPQRLGTEEIGALRKAVHCW